MRARRRQEIESLFEAALELPASDRAAWLTEVCGDDAELRREVEALLEAHGRAGGLLESALPGAGEILDEYTPTYDRVGPYRIVDEIGRGGMGIVYLAEDTRHPEASTPVAIKILGASRYSPKSRQRFEREQRILAALDHPNIARLLDAGLTDDGAPYLVMEYVEGLPIDVHCAQRELGIAQRLRTFCTVARAVHYAHEANVVHRDLKPSNVLVMPDGTVKLLDFGIAKIIAAADEELASPLTDSGVLLLTPSYASPEQVLNDPITPATDVYGLGVLLYELLTGRLPLDLRGRQPHEIISAILEGTPVPPSRVDYPESWPPPIPVGSKDEQVEHLGQFRRFLEKELDEIVMMALAKEPTHRQPSAKRLAEEIEARFQADS